jgi:hypothetical protein
MQVSFSLFPSVGNWVIAFRHPLFTRSFVGVVVWKPVIYYRIDKRPAARTDGLCGLTHGTTRSIGNFLPCKIMLNSVRTAREQIDDTTFITIQILS